MQKFYIVPERAARMNARMVEAENHRDAVEAFYRETDGFEEREFLGKLTVYRLEYEGTHNINFW